MSSTIHVAIIDDGVAEYISGLKFRHHFKVDKSNNITLYNGEHYITHGTVCAGIIGKYAENIELISIKVLDSHGAGSVEQLLIALEWCLNNKVDIINLSLGSIYFYDIQRVRKQVNLCANSGIIPVCASSNSDFITYPTSFSNVIGVRCDYDGSFQMTSDEHYILIDRYNGIEFCSYSEHLLSNPFTGELYTSDKCNSFAAPLITAKICNILSHKKPNTVNGVLNNLYLTAVNPCYAEHDDYFLKPDWISMAVIIDIGFFKDSKASYYFDIALHKSLSCIDDLYALDTGNYNYDTLIFRFGSPLNFDERFFKYINSLNKNVVFIDVYFENSLFKPASYKVWHNNLKYYAIHKDTGHLFKPEGDIPNIFIFIDDCHIDTLLIIYYLKKYFSEESYNTNCICDDAVSILYDIDYIPLISIHRESSKTMDYVNKMNYLANHDLNIWFSSFNNKQFYKKLVHSLKADIIIDIELVNSIIVASLHTDNSQKYGFHLGSIKAVEVRPLYNTILSLLT